ncbi:MAG: phenylalanine--tRNA ligase beta subunit [Gemmatimonadales bacterium]|nr:MAG: phenylalanine--tRNA ligase beta subunit [Gemmatimonadales bacterium]
MNVSINWLSDMLGRKLDPADAAHRLAMLGAGVEAIEPLHRELSGILVGLVEEVKPHPNADRLTLCRVNAGESTVEVVCGAPNVTAGKKYPYAPEGAALPGGMVLTAKKIRGIVSHGMLCSARELGLGTDHEGIMELDTEAPPGTPLLEALPLADTRLVLEITANRPDLLGHKGVARELAAVYGLAVKLPAFPKGAPDGKKPRRVERSGSVDGIEVIIEDVEGCPRYIAAVIRGVKVGPSPEWLQARLRGVGARSINNVVDATNYILYELNQPLHAFDLNRLKGGKVVIRRAREGESIVTLDGEKRQLNSQMTAICDAEDPQAIAGIMGGAESEVTQSTTDILLECAYFDPKRIRATRKALKLDTEASYRFERGTDIEAMPDAVRRAVALIRTVAGGEEPDAPVDVYPEPVRPRVVVVRPGRVEQLLGTPIPREEIERYLASVGFAVVPKRDRLHVQVPGWRPDVSREVDLIEEVARLRGYDSFPVEYRPFRPSSVPDDPVERLKDRIRRLLTGFGLHEARTMPLCPAEDGQEQVAVANPISKDHAALRTRILPGLAKAVEHNWSVKQRDIRLFEIGNVFRRVQRGGGLEIEETLHLAAVVTGARMPPHWSDGQTAPDWDLWDIKGMFVESARLVAPEGEAVPEGEGWVWRDRSGRIWGRAGGLALDRPAWAASVFGFELAIEVKPRVHRSYVPLPATPAVERDLALVLGEGVSAAQVEAVLREQGGSLLEEFTIFDEYRGLGTGVRSVAWRLRFRAPERTLRDAEVDRMVERILKALKERLGVVRREA